MGIFLALSRDSRFVDTISLGSNPGGVVAVTLGIFLSVTTKTAIVEIAPRSFVQHKTELK